MFEPLEEVTDAPDCPPHPNTPKSEKNVRLEPPDHGRTAACVVLKLPITIAEKIVATTRLIIPFFIRADVILYTTLDTNRRFPLSEACD